MSKPVARLPSVLCGLALVALMGCLPPQASFRPGLSTSEVNGVIDLPPPDDPGDGPPIVVVFRSHTLLTGFNDEPDLTRQDATLAHLGQYNQFTIPVPTDVVAVEIIVAAPERLTDTFHFHRQIGMGTITYKPSLPRMPNWRSHFYTYLQPQLEHLITEPRYQLSAFDQERLTRWLNDQKHRLETHPAVPGAEK